jgi:hypothetical protein
MRWPIMEDKMTLEEAGERVREIEARIDDDEVAHSMEDDLYADFIKSIIRGKNNKLARIAQEVLKTKELNFDRHCA